MKKTGKGKQRKKLLAEIIEELKKLGRRLTFDDLLTITIGLYGAKALNHPYGFLWGSVGYKLARSESTLAAGAGLGTLAVLGLAGIPKEVWSDLYEASLPEKPEWWPFEYPEGWPRYR